MIDISKFSGSPYVPYVFLGIIALIYLICILKFTKNGFIKSFFSVIYLILLVFVCIKYGKIAAEKILGFGFIPAQVLKFSGQQVASLLSYVLIFIIWLIVIKILNRIFKKLYKADKKAMRFFGFLFSLPFASILSIAFVAVCSPFLVHGSEKMFVNQYSKIYVEKFVEPIQDQMYSVGIPCSVEAIAANKAPSDEEKPVYYAAFKNVRSFIINPENYLSSSFESAETKDQFVKDLTIVNNCISAIGNQKITTNYVLYLTNYASLSAGSSISCGENYESLYSSFTSLGIAEDTATLLQAVFIE